MDSESFKELDPLLHSQLRLSVVSLLVALKQAEFNYLKEKTGSTAGNLSVQLAKLSEAGYLEITKSFRDKYPLTQVSLTKKGLQAFETYVQRLQSYIKPGTG